jgi:hypothetical protein
MEYQVTLHTDHFQFFVADEQYQTNTGRSITRLLVAQTLLPSEQCGMAARHG